MHDPLVANAQSPLLAARFALELADGLMLTFVLACGIYGLTNHWEEEKERVRQKDNREIREREREREREKEERERAREREKEER